MPLASPIWGVSLGGYYSARAAAFEKRLKACVSLSGPYNWVETSTAATNFHARRYLARVPGDHLRYAENFSLLEQDLALFLELGIERKRQYRRNEVRLLLQQHGRHGRQRAFQHGVVALFLEPVLFQHGTDGDVDGAAAAVGADHLALEILDLVDAAVLAHVVLAAVMAGHAILEFVGNDANVVEPGILDRDGERGIGEVGNFQFVIGDRRDHLRRALVTDGLQRVGLAQVLGEVLLFQDDRAPVGDWGHPVHTDLYRFRAVGGAGTEQAERAHAGQRKFHHSHCVLPNSPGLRVCWQAWRRVGKDCRASNRFWQAAHRPVLPAMRYSAWS